MSRKNEQEDPQVVLDRLQRAEPPRSDTARHGAWKRAISREKQLLTGQGDAWRRKVSEEQYQQAGVLVHDEAIRWNELHDMKLAKRAKKVAAGKKAWATMRQRAAAAQPQPGETPADFVKRRKAEKP